MADGVALLTVDHVERLMPKGCLGLPDTHAPPDQLAACLDENVDMRQIIERYYADINGGDWAGWLTLLHDDIVLDEQLDGHAEGKALLAGVVDVFAKRYSTYQLHPRHVVVEGEHAAVVWRCEAVTTNGTPIDAVGSTYFRLQDGKIVYLRTMYDSVPYQAVTN